MREERREREGLFIATKSSLFFRPWSSSRSFYLSVYSAKRDQVVRWHGTLATHDVYDIVNVTDEGMDILDLTKVPPIMPRGKSQVMSSRQL